MPGLAAPSTGATRENNFNGLGLNPKRAMPVSTNKIEGIRRPKFGANTIGPLAPNAPQLPPMPFNFNASGSGSGSGGGGGGGGTGGGGGGGTIPAYPSTTSFTGSKSDELMDTFGKANQLFNEAPDLMDNAILNARDASSMQGKELAKLGMLAGGRTSPGMTMALGAQTNRNIADAARKATQDTFNMRLGALSPALGAGQGVANDLRAQQNEATKAYLATTGAWDAANKNQIAREQMSLNAQIAAMNAQMGLYNNMFSMYGNMMSPFFSAAANMYRV